MIILARKAQFLLFVFSPYCLFSATDYAKQNDANCYKMVGTELLAIFEYCIVYN